MKGFLTAICAIGCSAIVACAVADQRRRVEGYPVYKFLNFGGINSKGFKAQEEKSKQCLGEGFDTIAKSLDLFVSCGFDFHTPLEVHTESGKEVEVYIRDADYKLLWKTSPHDLAAQMKSHRVTITYLPVKVGDEWVNRAVTFSAEMVDRKPIIRK